MTIDQTWGDIDQPSQQDAQRFFGGDGRAMYQINKYAAFVTDGDSVHIHTLPYRDDQNPSDSHVCVGSFPVENLETTTEALTVMKVGIEKDIDPQTLNKKLLELADSPAFE